MAGQIGKLGLGAAVATFLALTLFWALDNYHTNKHAFLWKDLIELLDFFIIGVTIVVVAVPEGNNKLINQPTNEIATIGRTNKPTSVRVKIYNLFGGSTNRLTG